MRTFSSFGWLVITLTLAGCGAEDEEPTPPASTSTGIEIEGSWASSFGGTETIDDVSWTTDFGSSTIADYSNSENVAITLSPDDADFNPGTYSRNVWTELSGGSFYYCTTDFGLATEEEAQAKDTAPDASDPDNTGCGGEFAWTKLTKQ